jgi:4-hydroxy-tetrahydrodipicolinate synthase
MAERHSLGGVYVAAITPVDGEYIPDFKAIHQLMEFYADSGCHGALILGSTGEGPSFNPADRFEIMQAAAQIKQTRPDFHLFAGTGTPSLMETIGLNQAAFGLGYDGVVTLPPYYFRGATEDGLFSWFSQVIRHSVPEGKILLGYHIPQTSGVRLSVRLLKRLAEAFPQQFGGAKDSEGSLENTQAFAREFPDKLILVGNDRLMSAGLEAGASGCITALANLVSPWLRMIYDQFGQEGTAKVQENVSQARTLLDGYAPFPATIKALMNELGGSPDWPVLPPLVPLAPEVRAEVVGKFKPLLEHG